jgi:hypothetical protein
MDHKPRSVGPLHSGSFSERIRTWCAVSTGVLRSLTTHLRSCWNYGTLVGSKLRLHSPCAQPRSGVGARWRAEVAQREMHGDARRDGLTDEADVTEGLAPARAWRRESPRAGWRRRPPPTSRSFARFPLAIDRVVRTVTVVPSTAATAHTWISIGRSIKYVFGRAASGYLFWNRNLRFQT